RASCVTSVSMSVGFMTPGRASGLTFREPVSKLNFRRDAATMTPFETLTLVAYFFVLIILAVYGWHRYYLVYLYMRNRDNEPKTRPLPDPLPVVTVQLPLYNE